MSDKECLLNSWDGRSIQDYHRRRKLCLCAKCIDLRKRQAEFHERVKDQEVETPSITITHVNDGENSGGLGG